MYAEYYGLTGRPFQLTPDPRFYFASATHRKAMAYLGYGMAQGEGFIVITGDIGAGKTTLVGHLMETIDPSRLTAAKITSTQVEGDDMLRMVAQAFGIATEGADKPRLLAAIEAFLNAQALDGKRTLLIVDEAQNLPVSALEELRMLSNVQLGGDALLQIFLLGQPEFRDKLYGSDGLEQLRQRVIATHHLEPMEANEIEAYLVHRLALVGWKGNPDFTTEACAALYRHSDGVPRRLNMLAGRVMLHGSVERLDVIDEQAVEAVVADMAADDSPRAVPVPEESAGAGPDARVVDLPTAAAPAASSTTTDAAELRDRIASLEAQLEEQDTVLRRVLTLLIDWVEADTQRAHDGEPLRESAA